VEIELRAQVEKARAMGLRPTHLDSHQFRLQLTAGSLSQSYLRVARSYRLPVLLTRGWLIRYPHLQSLVTAQDVVLDRIAAADATVNPEEWPEFYRRALKSLPAGVSEVTIHPGFDGPELRAFFGDRPGWGAAWRQRDFDYFTSETFRNVLAEERITLITWREIAAQLA
jgi:chitin disaccharide deacetylase